VAIVRIGLRNNGRGTPPAATSAAFAPGPLHPLVWHRAPLRGPYSGTSIRSNTSFRATIEGVKCRPIENRPRQTPLSCRPSPRVEPVIACAHDANLPPALLDAVERPRSPLSLTRKAPRYRVERYSRQPQLIVVADSPSVRNTVKAPGFPALIRAAAPPQDRSSSRGARGRRIDLHRAARGRVTGYG
jgi:hypothetical protein